MAAASPASWLRTSHDVLAAGRWNPWQALVQDHPEYRVITEHELPPGLMGLMKAPRIWLCSTLNQAELDCTLAHELVHIELGPMPEDRVEALAAERLVCEVTSRRMIPARDLLHIAVTRPEATLKNWARHLRVDLGTLHDRLITLSPAKRAALTAVRGGPLPAVPEKDLWDDPDCPHPVPGAAAARRRCGTCAGTDLAGGAR